jgi:hypothetical protein
MRSHIDNSLSFPKQTKLTFKKVKPPTTVFVKHCPQTPGFLPEFPFSRDFALYLLEHERRKNLKRKILSEQKLDRLSDRELEDYLNKVIP